MFKKYCFCCGSDNIVLDREYSGEEVGLSEDITVAVYKCEYCGAIHEVHSTPEDEQMDYPHWNKELPQ